MQKSYWKLGLLALLLAGLAGASSCANYATQPYGTVSVTSVKITPQTVHLATIGETSQLVATVAPLDATDRTVTWESSDPSIASVDANGKVTARSAGVNVFVTVITHDGRFQSSSNISVVP